MQSIKYRRKIKYEKRTNVWQKVLVIVQINEYNICKIRRGGVTWNT